MHVDLVVFDIAGTTVRDDDAVHRCLADALSAAGVTTTRDAINAVMGMPKPLAIRELAAADRGTPPDAGGVADIHADFERRMLQHYRTSDIHEAAGAAALFRGLRANGAKVALDTGFNRTITDAIVDRLGWREMLDATVASDEVPRGRPHPDLLRRAMQLTGCGNPRRVAKVGDTPADLGEGTAAGCRFVVGITSGSHTRDELLAHPHTHLVETLDELWPILGLRTLLFTPGPLTTAPRVKAAMLRDVGSRDADFIAVVADVRDRLLAVAGVSRQTGYETVLLPGSGTYAVEAMLRTFAPPHGTLLIVDNGAYGARMVEIARTAGLPHVALGTAATSPVAPDAVGIAIDREPSVGCVAVVHCETTTGVLNPLREVAAVVHRRGRRLLVDGMSSFAGIPLDLDEEGIDALAASSNKCLEAVPGCAFVIARRALLASSDGRAGSLALDLAAQFRAFERDGQFRFTPPTQVVLSMARALDELEREGGVEARAARYRANHRCLIAGMRTLGFTEIVAPAHQSDIITAFRYPDDPAFTFGDFYERLRRRGLIIYPGKLAGIGCFRIGTIGQIGLEEIERLLAGIRDVLAELAPCNPSGSSSGA